VAEVRWTPTDFLLMDYDVDDDDDDDDDDDIQNLLSD